MKEEVLGTVVQIRDAAIKVRNKKHGMAYNKIFIEIMEAASAGEFSYKTKVELHTDLVSMLKENGFAVNQIGHYFHISW